MGIALLVICKSGEHYQNLPLSGCVVFPYLISGSKGQ